MRLIRHQTPNASPRTGLQTLFRNRQCLAGKFVHVDAMSSGLQAIFRGGDPQSFAGFIIPVLDQIPSRIQRAFIIH